MDSNTLTLVLGAVVLVVVLNFLFLDDSQSGPNTHTRTSTPAQVTPQMIEAVQAVAPGLSRTQIKADLQLTGNIQATVERYLAGVIVAVDEISSSADGSGTEASCSGLGKERTLGSSSDGKGPFGGLSFDEKKLQLILENRRKLESKGKVFF